MNIRHKWISNNLSSLKLVNAVEDVSERPLVSLAVFVELGVGGLHLYLHVLEETVLPFWSVHVLSLLGHQCAQCLQVPILLYSLFCLFLLRNNFAFSRKHITLVPPLVLVVCFVRWLLKVWIVVVLVFLLLSWLGRSEWSDSIEIFVVSKSHQHWVLVDLENGLLS